MRLQQLKVAGFRGFNEERTLLFDDRLTLIAAPNSHGKTSITEALEFLLFGQTSKVAHAHSKEEYHDSYRNSHWPSAVPAYIEADLADAAGTTLRLKVELDSAGNTRRFVNGSAATDWPFAGALDGAASPFILQHALKYLLLVAPTDRFQGFARLLGLNDVDALQRAIISLCTKPEATIPPDGKTALAEWEALQARFMGLPLLEKARKDLAKGAVGVTAAYLALDARADKLLKGKIAPLERVARLIRFRDEQAAKVFAGTVALRTLDDSAKRQLLSDEEALGAAVSESFLKDYSAIAASGVAERLSKEAGLLSIGVELIRESPKACPLCGQPLTQAHRKSINHRHDAMKQAGTTASTTHETRSRIRGVIEQVRARTARHEEVLGSRSADLLRASGDEHRAKVVELFGSDSGSSWEVVRLSAAAIAPLQDELRSSAKDLQEAIQACEAAVEARTADMATCEGLGKALHRYLLASQVLATKLEELEPTLVGPARILRQAIDEIAGTKELSLLVDLYERRPAVERALKVREALDGLKVLKKAVEQTVGETMEAAINADLSGAVMSWYGRIRTKGDPDVHFSGFAMQRTKDGDFKKGKVKIGARSYGVDLASAVSSLSESKLNALGLCVSIANALRSPGPWEFLVLDDPIQSWDAEHEAQFIEVIRTLADKEGKQVVLLTHKDDWARQVSMGCRGLNGLRLEITGYTKEGPHLREVPWAAVDQRIDEADALARSKSATKVQLQQAEGEVRLAVCQLASEIAQDLLGRTTSPHNLNKTDVRAILNESKCPAELTDKVYGTFGTADDAHHAPKSYSGNAQRVRKYLETLRELREFRRSKSRP